MDYTFDPAINYGPNDGGVSAISIALVVIALLLAFWLFGSIYGQIEKFFQKREDEGED